MSLCHSYSCISLGNHTMYFSFDKSDNLVLMEENLPVNFCAMVPGQVGVFFCLKWYQIIYYKF